MPHFNFAPLKNAIAELADSAPKIDAALAAGVAPERLEAVNRLLYLSERKLTSAEGLPGRDWYRHQIYAPGFYTGYGVKTLPRVREAIEAERYDEVDAQLAHTAETIRAFNAHLEALGELLVP